MSRSYTLIGCVRCSVKGRNRVDAAELIEARARAELEMFYRMTVEEGARYLEWCAAMEFPLRSSRTSKQAPREEVRP